MPGRTTVDKQKIRELAKQGVQADQIARRTGVSRGSVYAVLRAEKGKAAK
jgi:DNA invertase Pin-like site-specific DNA recombinase